MPLIGTPGSIPACAGKPQAPGLQHGKPVVHPRVCGEAPGRESRNAEGRGRSPRVRGSPFPTLALPLNSGSIPACAGKPSTSTARRRSSRVHPRVCGEAGITVDTGESKTGPSPRVRGSPDLGGARAPDFRSIPACAGKPCGRSRAGGHIRSIPACAGKPRLPASVVAQHRVHPRVCGEAHWSPASSRRKSGPSPRVRGSPQVLQHAGLKAGSIPACAGKPLLSPARSV